MFSQRRLTLTAGILTLSSIDLEVLLAGAPEEREILSLTSVRGTLTSAEVRRNSCNACIPYISEPTYWNTTRHDVPVGTVADISLRTLGIPYFKSKQTQRILEGP